jgi:aspartate beta-hydroxylase
MTGHPSDPRALAIAGRAALKRKDPAAAKIAFSSALAGGATADAWYGLALAHLGLGDAQAEERALDEALKLDSRHLPALIAKGDLYLRLGDKRAAQSHFDAARSLGAAHPALPTEWRAELARIEAASAAITAEYEAHLMQALAARGFGSPGSERVAHAVDLLLGRRQVYLQQPRNFYFPELPQRQFYERSEFAWVPILEAATGAIREELRAVLAGGGGVVPYIRRSPRRPAFATHPLTDNPDWSAFFLIESGSEVAANAARCPRTLAALASVPLARIPGRTPSVLFSLLRPGTRIKAHNGLINTRLICHLPLVIPRDCGLRVGNETRAWREGELVIFDDSIEHEAWNGSEELRAVLIFDIWRPELSDRERTLVAAMIEAVDRFGGPRVDWSD